MEEINILSVDSRLKKLELDYQSNITEILTILKKLQGRLLGSIDSDQPGLIADMRQLKQDIDKQKIDLAKIDMDITKLTLTNQGTQIIIRDVEELKKSVEQINKYKWIVYGAAILAGFIINYLVKMIEIFKK